MANNIGIRLSVDGEQKFKTAMKQAANSVKDVDTRLKLATAEFKKNGDAQKLMQTRAKTLNEEIKRQTDIVDSLEDALQTVEKQYGENSTQALNYEAQLNKARQKLVQMETALEVIARNVEKVDGIKISLLDKEKEIRRSAFIKERLRIAGLI